MAEPSDDFIDEDPMTSREIDARLRGGVPWLSRRDRRALINALRQAGLIVFSADAD